MLNNDLNYHDSLDTHFSQALDQTSGSSMLSYVAFESYKNEGYEIIQNRQLRNEILNLFEGTYHQLNNRINNLGKTFNQVIELKHDLFLRKPGYRYAPFNLDELKGNKQFYSWLSYIKDTRLWVTSELRRAAEETNRVLQLIKEEVGK